MTFFPDLSPYRYGFAAAGWDQSGPPSIEPTELYRWMWGPEGAFDLPELSVGWLEPPNEYSRGRVSAPLAKKLERLCQESRYHLTRGFHPCGICGNMTDGLGSSEIRIQDGGVVYAAPNKIAHYVSAHAYAPPEGFVAALRRCEGLAQPRVDVQRPVTMNMIPREDVSIVLLEIKIQDSLRVEHREEIFQEVSLRDCQKTMEVTTRIKMGDRPEPFTRSWQVPKSALLNMSQAVYGVISMLEAVHTEHALSSLADWRRTRAGGS